MGICKPPERVKLICGMLTANKSLFDISCSFLARRLGEIDFISQDFPFDSTAYYNEELGEPIWRRFVSFRKVIFPDALAQIKLFSNQIERALSSNGKRRINLDPGLLSENSINLASTKENPFRLYLGKEIYAGLTLTFAKGRFLEHPWTYPDFRKPATKNILAKIRKIYLNQRKAKNKKGTGSPR
ncbi:DUF4416 family protein [bacterium]|nr:DUF4416 family protein [bacterium]MBU1599230.1 DUF4416 family protein [bacterium]MBU2462445.1 DUF4416 family protein [bacterium]